MTGKPPKNINPEDTALFRDAVGEVRPVQPRRVDLRRPPPGARARFRRQDDAQVLVDSLRESPHSLGIETGEELVFRRPEVSQPVFRRLRRGEFAIRGELDLHGMTNVQAREELRRFIAECVAEEIQCVRIIHGKGLRSGPRGPVLKASVNSWLRRWQDVLAFCSAPPRDGGTGAIYVLLRR